MSLHDAAQVTLRSVRYTVKVWCYLAEVGVKIHHTIAELLHILGQQLVCVSYPVVQVAHFVISEASEETEPRLGHHKHTTGSFLQFQAVDEELPTHDENNTLINCLLYALRHSV